MPAGFHFRPRFCDSSIRAPRDFVFMVLIATEILFLGLVFDFVAVRFILLLFSASIYEVHSDFGWILFPMILFLPMELGFVFSGFEETGFLSFSSTRCVHVCVLWIPMRMACLD